MNPFILLFLGLLLVFLEFYTPGGILAMAGAIFLIAALLTFFMSAALLASIGFALLVICGVAGTVWLALWRIRKSSKENTFFLSQDQEGFQSTSFESGLVGKEGVALTDLRPSGFVLIEGKRFAATCRGAYIEKGSALTVAGGEGSQLIVKPKA
jgi:membrane-bound serine protease (ClpP class)